MFIKAIGQKQNISLEQFEKTLFNWFGTTDEPKKLFLAQKRSNFIRIYNMLLKKSHQKTLNPHDFLDNGFVSILAKYAKFLPDIIKTLSVHNNYSLLTNSFNFESCHIDANGNHQRFNTGSDEIEFSYYPNSNQIYNVTTY